MKQQVLGLHHVTAPAGPAQRNHDFYAALLGMRFIKKTVSDEDPGIYHFYYGNESGTPGTLLTFFSTNRLVPVRTGGSRVSAVSFSVPSGSFPFWLEYFEAHHVPYLPLGKRFDEPCLAFVDPDGLSLELIVSHTPDERAPWTTRATGLAVAVRGLHAVELTVSKATATVALLTEVLGYRVLQHQGVRWRLKTEAVPQAALIDVVELPDGQRESRAVDSLHRVAFRVASYQALLYYRKLLISRNLAVTQCMDHRYFHSLCFRVPGGVLFELATDNPGFFIDEAPAELGTHLMLPPHFESRRPEISAFLPPLTIS